VGALSLTCEAVGLAPQTQRFTCTATVMPNADASVALLTIAARDAAGNEALEVPFIVVLDTDAPALSAAASVSRLPAYAPATVADDEVYLNDDATARLSFGATEPLGRAPTVMVGGMAFAPTTWTVADTFFVIEVPGVGLAEGRLGATAELIDLAGNRTFADVGAVTVDRTPPPALGSADGLRFFRAPYGVEGHPAPQYEVRLCPGPWDFCEGLAPAAESGASIAVFTATKSGCAPLRTKEAQRDGDEGAIIGLTVATDSVCVRQTDRPGNNGSVDRVLNGPWRASMREALDELALENPLSLVTGTRWGRLLYGANRSQSASAPVASADAQGSTTVGAVDWHRLDSFPVTPEGYWSATAFDRARGVGLRDGECWYDDDDGHGSFEWSPLRLHWTWNGFSWGADDLDDGVSGPRV
jgi:hypothetical protein